MSITTPLWARRSFLGALVASTAQPLLEAARQAGRQSGAQAPRSGSAKAPLAAHLVCGGGGSHDYDFARRRLLDALYAAGGIRTQAASSYADTKAIEAAGLLVSYTSLVTPDQTEAQALRRYLEKGGRWFALHASNFPPDDSRDLSALLGSRFITHSPYRHFPVSVVKPNDPLLAGIGSFEVDDELYVIEHADDIEVLMQTRWGGEVLGGRRVEEDVRPLMYRRRVGAGGVLYLALGHCNQQFDLLDGPDQPGRPGPWNLPVFKELVRRGIEWAARRRAL